MEHFYRDHFNQFLRRNNSENASLRHQSNTAEEEQTNESVGVLSKEDIVFENDNLQLFVRRTYFRRQKNFKFLDELFLFLVKQKNSSNKMPLIVDILDFLHAGFLHILDTIKTFYEKGKVL